MPKGPTKRRPETQARLQEAARQVFAEVGFHGATISDISERAGYTNGAFYSNYANKDELFLALVDANAERVREQLQQRIETLNASDLTLDRIAELFAMVQPEDQQWFLISTEFTLHAIRHPDVARRFAEHKANLRAELVTVMETAFARTGRAASVDLGDLVRLLIAIREGSLRQSFVEPDELPPGHLERAFWPLLFNAVTTPVEGAQA
ncbi:TetR/AcrR family transcriptional regulator [Allokutzneria sp. A3M-2-11 16]|uniref:TetR/AcrR family transcriptional regulator n=1 Tax=Allokutzneria sp. A3M-2-11 16 TaxID=2962043 RepID=UPI0020B7971F|nr:TetR/AcrR family transcriptional regulator [Allokutzneria sp. A3M-2-11 16]MCP3800288.1 TetR/AcrR family transcriptional regulator [Allokutzneria sp. A3M-2-11 16]